MRIQRAGQCLIGSLALFVFGTVAEAQNLNPSFREKSRTPGLYLVERGQGDHTTTQEPLAPLDPDLIHRVLSEEVSDHAKVVIVGPSIYGTEKDRLAKIAHDTLGARGLNPEVIVMRHPHGILEKSVNILPRREDWEKPERQELRVSVWTQIVIGEAFATVVILFPRLTQMSDFDLGATASEFLNSIAMPLHIGIPLVVLNYGHLTLLAVPARFWSNHNIRLNAKETLIRQFLLSVFFSTNFYLLSRYPALWDAAWSASAESLSAGFLNLLGTVIPASIFNMLARTSVHKSIHLWEHQGTNRKVARAYMEGAASLVIGVPYILSTLPILKPVMKLPLMDLNPLHFYLLGVGVVGSAAWVALKPPAVLRSCQRALGALLGRT